MLSQTCYYWFTFNIDFFCNVRWYRPDNLQETRLHYNATYRVRYNERSIKFQFLKSEKKNTYFIIYCLDMWCTCIKIWIKAHNAFLLVIHDKDAINVNWTLVHNCKITTERFNVKYTVLIIGRMSLNMCWKYTCKQFVKFFIFALLAINANQFQTINCCIEHVYL